MSHLVFRISAVHQTILYFDECRECFLACLKFFISLSKYLFILIRGVDTTSCYNIRLTSGQRTSTWSLNWFWSSIFSRRDIPTKATYVIVVFIDFVIQKVKICEYSNELEFREKTLFRYAFLGNWCYISQGLWKEKKRKVEVAESKKGICICGYKMLDNWKQ